MKSFTLNITLLFLFTTFPQDEGGINRIEKDSLLKIVSVLSSKEFDGRLPGSKSYDLAANYAAEKFSQMNLKPFGDAGYF